MRNRARQKRIEQIRRLRQSRRNDWFFDSFDHEFDKAFENPLKFTMKVGLISLVLNLIFWTVLIAVVALVVWVLFL